MARITYNQPGSRRVGREPMYFFLEIALMFGMVVGLTNDVAGQPDLLGQLAKGIAESEKKLLNLRVDGRSRSELWDATESGWKYAGEMEVTAWYPGVPGGKVRIEVHKDVAIWIDGAAPFAQESYAIAYNGHISQRLQRSVGTPVQQHQDLRGKVGPKRSEEVAGGNWASGWAYSLYGFWDRAGKRLSSVFDSKDFVLAAQEAQYEGVKCIQLTAAGPREHYTWYLDPARGYAILGYERMTPQSPHAVLSRLVMEQFVQAAPGIYYPSKGFAENFLPDGTPFARSLYEASKVLANDPSFSEEVFTIKWPAGVTILDETTGNIITVEGDENEIKQRIDRQVEEVKTGIAKQSRQSGARTKSWIWATAVGIVVVVALAVILAVRLGRKK
jgi:hypothetical protein